MRELRNAPVEFAAYVLQFGRCRKQRHKFSPFHYRERRNYLFQLLQIAMWQGAFQLANA